MYPWVEREGYSLDIMESRWSDNFVQAVTVTSEQELAGPTAVDKGRAKIAIWYKIFGVIMETQVILCLKMEIYYNC